MRSSAVNIIMCLAGQVPLLEVIISVFADLIVIFVCFPVHECAHGLVAKLCGDDTADKAGRVTLNPFAHIDWIGALMIFICNIGWAKPTPVDLRRCKKVPVRAANALVSIAGPLSNLLMAFIFVLISRILLVTVSYTETLGWILIAVSYAAQINIMLALINLIPIPPFDGYLFLASFLPYKAQVFMERYGRIFQIVLLILLFSDVLDIPLGLATNGIMLLMNMAVSFIG